MLSVALKEAGLASHYGMYRDTGVREWAFDPTPHLRKWEREAVMAKKKKKKLE